MFFKKSYQIYKANRVFYEDRVPRRDINLYRKSMESIIGLVLHTLKSLSLYPMLTLLFFGVKSSDLSLVKPDRVKSDARSHCHFNSKH